MNYQKIMLYVDLLNNKKILLNKNYVPIQFLYMITYMKQKQPKDQNKQGFSKEDTLESIQDQRSIKNCITNWNFDLRLYFSQHHIKLQV